MLTPMVERVFLGWDRPFLLESADWLLEHRDELAHWLVVVPTSQAGRRLRELMAESAGALLSPRIMTPGSFLSTPDADVAADWIERLAWLETLEKVGDWSAYNQLFPEHPDNAEEWAGGLAGELVALRHRLQENGLSLASTARLLAGSVEAGRWADLGRLEETMERNLRAWGFKSRSQVLSLGLSMPDGISRIVLAGVTEMPPLVERAWLAWQGPLTTLIGAPSDESEHFSEIGRPLATWTERTLPWPRESNGAVHLVADSRQQAAEALRVIGDAGSASDQIALGSADVDTGDELARVFTREGWPAFHPAARPPTSSLTRWLKVWCRWLASPDLSTVADLLTLPETGILIKGRRALKAEQLSRMRNDWMALRPDDLRHRIANSSFRSEKHEESARETLTAVESLEGWRADFLREDFTGTLNRLLETLGHHAPDAMDAATQMIDWLSLAAPMIRKVNRSAAFWIDLMLSEIPPAPLEPPAGRVIDIQGWLELFFEPGSHLVLCGMNEGKVPARNSGDPWLGETAGTQLGLSGNSVRAARDAFLYHSMLMARRDGGRTDLICAKSGAGGESLLPSRLLLAADRSELPDRVRFLFREIEPPEAGMRWQADWQWQPRTAEIPKRLAVTSLATYLACPFRFYLKHALRMQTPEPDRGEWNARDFGNVAHEVMERWGRDTEARDYSKSEAIHDWLSAELDGIVREWFGKRLPLAVRVQTEALRQRLSWFARSQACIRAEGWEIIEIEHPFEIPSGESTISAKIDRIDRHRDDGRLRVVDYKTGKVDTVEKSHRRTIRSGTVLPEHLATDCPASYSGEEKGKPADFLWTNLQLPLYAVAVERREGVLPTPCYFTLGATANDVAIHEWTNFSHSDLEAAKSCTDWIVSRITEGIFWPPAAKTTYDDYAALTAGRPMAEMFAPRAK